MNNKQPEALRLADVLEDTDSAHEHEAAAAELRRLYAKNQGQAERIQDIYKQLNDTEKEVDDLRRSQREAWHYSYQLEQERKQLQAMLDHERTENAVLLRQALSTLEGLFGIPDQWTGDGGGAVAVWRFGGVEPVRATIASIKERLK